MQRVKTTLSTLLILAFASGPILAQAPSYTQFGSGCAGSAGVPLLEADAGSVPVLGGTFRARLSMVPDMGTAVGIIGLSTSSFAGFPILPFDLGPIDMPGCTLYTDVRRTAALAGRRPGIRPCRTDRSGSDTRSFRRSSSSTSAWPAWEL